MNLPVVIEVMRGERVESAHCGSGAVLDTDGGVLLAFGDVETPVFPRSAVKAFQALPLFESGAADRFGLTDREIALAVASQRPAPRFPISPAASIGPVARPPPMRSRNRGRNHRRYITTALANTPVSFASPAQRAGPPTDMRRTATPSRGR